MEDRELYYYPEHTLEWRAEAVNGFSVPTISPLNRVSKAGKLRVRVVRARRLKDSAVIGQMTSFVELKIGKEKKRTQKHKKGGVNPVWNEILEFDLKGDEGSMRVKAFNASLLSNNEIGLCRVPLDFVIQLHGLVPAKYSTFETAGQDKTPRGITVQSGSRDKTTGGAAPPMGRIASLAAAAQNKEHRASESQVMDGRGSWNPNNLRAKSTASPLTVSIPGGGAPSSPPSKTKSPRGSSPPMLSLFAAQNAGAEAEDAVHTPLSPGRRIRGLPSLKRLITFIDQTSELNPDQKRQVTAILRATRRRSGSAMDTVVGDYDTSVTETSKMAPADDGDDDEDELPCDPSTFHSEAWFDIGRDNNQQTPCGQILLAFEFVPTASASIMQRLSRNDNINPNHIFEVDIKAAVAMSDSKVPRVLHETIEFLTNEGLKTVGLFRVGAKDDVLKGLRDDYNKGRPVKFNTVHDCASLLKLYLRELPNPLIPFNSYSKFLAVEDDDEATAEDKAASYQSLLTEMNPVHRVCIHYLFEFLTKVVANEEFNKMNSRNLAIVFAPNLLRKEGDLSRKQSVFARMDLSIMVIQSLIDSFKNIFTPEVMQPQQLHLNHHLRTLSNDNEPSVFSTADDVDPVERLFNRGSMGGAGVEVSVSEARSEAVDVEMLEAAMKGATSPTGPRHRKSTSSGNFTSDGSRFAIRTAASLSNSSSPTNQNSNKSAVAVTSADSEDEDNKDGGNADTASAAPSSPQQVPVSPQSPINGTVGSGSPEHKASKQPAHPPSPPHVRAAAAAAVRAAVTAKDVENDDEAERQSVASESVKDRASEQGHIPRSRSYTTSTRPESVKSPPPRQKSTLSTKSEAVGSRHISSPPALVRSGSMNSKSAAARNNAASRKLLKSPPPRAAPRIRALSPPVQRNASASRLSSHSRGGADDKISDKASDKSSSSKKQGRPTSGSNAQKGSSPPRRPSSPTRPSTSLGQRRPSQSSTSSASRVGGGGEDTGLLAAAAASSSSPTRGKGPAVEGPTITITPLEDD